MTNNNITEEMIEAAWTAHRKSCRLEGVALPFPKCRDDLRAMYSAVYTAMQAASQPPVTMDGMVERAEEAVYDFLDARFPDGPMPGGVQLFAEDHLDAEFKHEAGCEALARAVLEAAGIPTLLATIAAKDEALERIREEANTVGPDWRETASMIDSICHVALESQP